MKKLFLMLLLTTYYSYGQQYVSPLGFTMNEANKKRFVEYIKKNVEETYSAIGLDNPSTLRMMEKENLKAFQELIKINLNPSLFKRVEKTYCNINLCNYSTLLMMYKQEASAASEELDWNR